MTSQTEVSAEIKESRRLETIARLHVGGLAAILVGDGVTVTGFTYKLDPYETLLVIKGVKDGAQHVCFVGAADAGSCLMKARKLAKSGKLAWRADKWGNGQV